MVKSVTVRAPCSTANLGPGFDVFGMALDAFYDEVTVTKKPKSFGIKIVSSDDIPLDPKKNTAGIVAMDMKESYNISDGLEIKIKKKVPAGYGMGSSAASAAACAIAIKELFSLEMSTSELLEDAASGEVASAGTVHYDNVAAALFGDFVVVNPWRPYCWSFPVPEELTLVVAIPKIKVPKQKTKVSRGVLPKNVKFSDAMENIVSVVSMVAEIAEKEIDFADWISFDKIITPARKKMIPGFDKIILYTEKVSGRSPRSVTISGAGPSVIAFCEGNEKEIGEAMKKGFKSAKVDCEIIICKPSDGPKIIKRK